MAEYYKAIITRDAILKVIKEEETKTRRDDSEFIQTAGGAKVHWTLYELAAAEAIVEAKAELGIGEALFSFGKELYKHIMNFENESTEKFKQAISAKTLHRAPELLSLAAERGVSSAYFLLGLMSIEGKLVERDVEFGLECLYNGAAKNHAYCYYYLALLYNEGVHVPKNAHLEFKYVKRAAEEGFAQMQHNLGLLYWEGRLVKKNDKLALAWLREATRNGYYPSYSVAGDILYEGSIPGLVAPDAAVEQNRLFALSMYLSAYQYGALFLESQIRQCLRDLIEIENWPEEELPKITFVEVPEQDRHFILEQYRKDQERRQMREKMMIQRMKKRDKI